MFKTSEKKLLSSFHDPYSFILRQFLNWTTMEYFKIQNARARRDVQQGVQSSNFLFS